MKQQIIIEWDNEDKAQGINIYTAHVQEDPSGINGALIDFGMVCESLVLMIHVLENSGIQNSPVSLRQAIKHLEDGFIDTCYSKSKINGLDKGINYSTKI